MSSNQLIITNKKIKAKKSLNIEFVIVGELDITRLNELPEQIVQYCFSFLSTEPKYPEPKLTTKNREELLKTCPSIWWKWLHALETRRMWNEKYVPVLTERFTKMSSAKLKQLTSDVTLFEFQGKRNKSQTKKSWIEYQIEHPPLTDFGRRRCIQLILFSKGMKPKNKNLLNPFLGEQGINI